MLAVTAVTLDLLLLAGIVVLLVLIAGFALAETALTRMNRSRAVALARGRAARRRAPAPPREAPRALPQRAAARDPRCSRPRRPRSPRCVAERVFGGGRRRRRAAGRTWASSSCSAEAAPKTWAVQHVDEAALRAAGPVATLAALRTAALDRPAGLIGIANVVLPGKGLQAGPFVSEEEFLALADEAAEAEVIEAEERVLITRVIEFGDTVAREVMVPRTDMVTVDASFRVGDAMEVVLLNGFSRIPVCGDGIDDVVGVLYAKDLMRAERDGREDDRRRHARPPGHTSCPRPSACRTCCARCRPSKFHMAIVDRRVRRHRGPRHARGPHRGAGRRDRRRVRRGGPHGRAAARRRAARQRPPRHRRGQRGARAATCPRATGTPSAGSVQPSSATSPREGDVGATSTASSCGPTRCRAGASAGSASPRSPSPIDEPRQPTEAKPTDDS